MFRDFRDIYDIHAWLRYVTWAGLVCLTVSLLWLSGGFPPRAWIEVSQLVTGMPQAWTASGPIALVHLIVLLLASLLWLVLWLVLWWFVFSLVQHHAVRAWRQRWSKLKSTSTTHARMAELIIPEWMPLQSASVGFPVVAKAEHEEQLEAQLVTQKREERAIIEEFTTVQLPGLRLPQRSVLQSQATPTTPAVQPELSTYAARQSQQVREAQQTQQAQQIQQMRKSQWAAQPTQTQMASSPTPQATPLHAPHSLRSSQLLPLEWQGGLEAQTEPLQRLEQEQTTARQQVVPSRSYAPRPYVAVQDIPTTPGRAERGKRAESVVATLPRSRSIPRFDIGVGWHAGIARQHNPNEDNLIVLQGTSSLNGQLIPFGLFVVADGMGGHAFGQDASNLAIQSMMQTIVQNVMKSENIDDDTLIELLVEGVGQANQSICKRVEERGKEMGTTITAALVMGTRAFMVNVGDSRTYLHRENEGLSQITNDHSLVARLVAEGTITPDDVYTHPERNKVYRSVGNPDGVEVDWFTVELDFGDSLLLCSDGLWEMVRDPDIERILSTWPDSSTASSELVKAALKGGGADNISVIVVRLE